MTEVSADDTCPPSARDFHSVPAGGKSSQSYIALISTAILSSADKRLVLADIYKTVSSWSPDRYNASTTAWRNSIRHNLSLNECFVKAGRAANGKGNYWAVHPACVESFARGDYRRRQARRRAVASKTIRTHLASLTSPAAESSDSGQLAAAGGGDGAEYATMSQVTVFKGRNVGRFSVEQLVTLIPPTVTRQFSSRDC